MMNRVKQVIAAVTAKITFDDQLFINRYLTTTEQILFWGMNPPDQRHVLNVAYTALKLAKEHSTIDSNLLVKCALLHDIGRIKGDMSTMDKIMTVIGYRFAPRWAQRWGRPGRGNRVRNIRHAFYIYFHHAQRSGALLKKIGACPRLIEIVTKHHETPGEDDPLELILLRKADDLH